MKLLLPSRQVQRQGRETRLAHQGKPRHNPHRDFYKLLVEHKDSTRGSDSSGEKSTPFPDWVDWDQIDRGQQVFYRYAGPSIVSLIFPVAARRHGIPPRC